ncbi:MAG: hypothetical protein E6Q67_09540 [Roseateles sp.]|nr:MAG: hypothetical protein E6Q67_09540 [Roseateles sp.]
MSPIAKTEPIERNGVLVEVTPIPRVPNIDGQLVFGKLSAKGVGLVDHLLCFDLASFTVQLISPCGCKVSMPITDLVADAIDLQRTAHRTAGMH